MNRRALAALVAGAAIFAVACAEAPDSGGSEGPKFVFVVEGQDLFATTKEALARWTESGARFRYEVLLARYPVPRREEKHLFAPGTVYLYAGDVGSDSLGGKCARKGGFDGASIVVAPDLVREPRIVMHEIGHALDLRHSDHAEDVMYPDVAVHAPSPGDIARLNESLAR